jgi:succinyl-CoA synthetase beta subunit
MVISGLYKAFSEKDCLLAEINPLVRIIEPDSELIHTGKLRGSDCRQLVTLAQVFFAV